MSSYNDGYQKTLAEAGLVKQANPMMMQHPQHQQQLHGAGYSQRFQQRHPQEEPQGLVGLGGNTGRAAGTGGTGALVGGIAGARLGGVPTVGSAAKGGVAGAALGTLGGLL